MESDHTDQWEVLSETSSIDSSHVSISIPHHNQQTDDNDDTHSVHSIHSIQSLESSTISTTSSIVNIPSHDTHQQSSFIPDINENKTINNNQNELIPSYVDIEAELQQQRQLIDELKSQLNAVTNERDQIREERDNLQERVNNDNQQMVRLRERITAMDRQNDILRQMKPKYHVKKYKERRKIKSKSAASITNRRGHRPSVPAKLRFRRQRTTHRTVYCTAGRGW